jgi:UDP-glucose 4-epimerase
MKKVFITGGAGFVGINLVRYLLESRKYQVTVLDNLSSGNYQLLKRTIEEGGGIVEEVNAQVSSDTPGKICFYRMDILDKMDVTRVLKDHEFVVHLAAQTGVVPSQQDPFKDANVNIIGTLNLLNGSVKNNVKKFIFASSAAPLGEQKPPMDEKKNSQTNGSLRRFQTGRGSLLFGFLRQLRSQYRGLAIFKCIWS